MPRIIVTMPTRNRANLIGRAIRSLGRQTYRDFKLLVGDDGCTDGTLEVVEREAKAADVAVRIVNGGRGRVGLSPMRNRLIRESDSEFVAVLDDDDEALPDRLATGVRMMENDPRMAVAGGAALCRDEAAAQEWVWRGPRTDMGIRRRALWGTPFRHSTVMMRRSHLSSQEPYEEAHERGEDAVLWAQMTKRDDIRLSSTGRAMTIMHFHGQQEVKRTVRDRGAYRRQIELNAEFLAGRGAPKDVAVARWLGARWWKVVPEMIPDPDRVRAVYVGLDRWGRRMAGPNLARAIELKMPWHGRLADMRGPVSLAGRVLALRVERVALAVGRRLVPPPSVPARREAMFRRGRVDEDAS